MTAVPVDVQTHASGFATSADRNGGLCACGCGKRVPRDSHYVSSHRHGHIGGPADPALLDRRFIAYYTGAADARNRRPHQGNPGDHIYTRGYNDQTARRAL